MPIKVILSSFLIHLLVIVLLILLSPLTSTNEAFPVQRRSIRLYKFREVEPSPKEPVKELEPAAEITSSPQLAKAKPEAQKNSAPARVKAPALEQTQAPPIQEEPELIREAEVLEAAELVPEAPAEEELGSEAPAEEELGSEAPAEEELGPEAPIRKEPNQALTEGPAGVQPPQNFRPEARPSLELDLTGELSARSLLYFPKIDLDPELIQGQGGLQILVELNVNSIGNVISAIIANGGSGDQALDRLLLQQIRKFIFSPKDSFGIDKGTILFSFKRAAQD